MSAFRHSKICEVVMHVYKLLAFQGCSVVDLVDFWKDNIKSGWYIHNFNAIADDDSNFCFWVCFRKVRCHISEW